MKGKEMISAKILYLKTILPQGARDLVFTADRLVCGGWVGRDRQALQAHIDELAALGVPVPGRVPIYMNFSTYLLTTDDEITVISDKTSGEVEFVLLCMGQEIWVTVGSDQTDRDIETKSIPASKQMYAKCLAAECWPYGDVQGHWDRLILRCWITKGRERILYQEEPLAALIGPRELLTEMPPEIAGRKDGLVFFSGTIPTKPGVVYGDAYDLELEDPVLQRTIRHHFKVKILPQYV
jgi:hypothetical protein